MRMESVVNNRKANVIARVFEKLDDKEFRGLTILTSPASPNSGEEERR
jgi:hypothetical protein